MKRRPVEQYRCTRCGFIMAGAEWRAFHFLPPCQRCRSRSFKEENPHADQVARNMRGAK